VETAGAGFSSLVARSRARDCAVGILVTVER
jgi:hypothetical protein